MEMEMEMETETGSEMETETETEIETGRELRMENVILRMEDLNIADGGRRRGFEYSFGMFWVDDQIIPDYQIFMKLLSQDVNAKRYLFEIRTNFKLKRSGGDEIMTMGSERFGFVICEFNHLGMLESQLSVRMKADYWMSDAEIESLVCAAWDFATQTAAADASLAVIPVVVGLDVWTVQQEGETIAAALDRAIRPESLIPVYVWPLAPMSVRKEAQVWPPSLRKKPNGICRHTLLFWHLERSRVEDEQGLAVMATCPVCLRNSSIGAQISVLPCCNHGCHPRCLFEWLLKSYSCPSCGLRIPPD